MLMQSYSPSAAGEILINPVVVFSETSPFEVNCTRVIVGLDTML